jgi:hypothetical protein
MSKIAYHLDTHLENQVISNNNLIAGILFKTFKLKLILNFYDFFRRFFPIH